MILFSKQEKSRNVIPALFLLVLALFVILFNRYDDFSLGMSFFKVADRFRSFAERVTSIDHWHYFAGFKKILDEKQIFFV